MGKTQTTTKYYENSISVLGPTVSKEKARYSSSRTKNDDGSVTIEEFDLLSNKLLCRMNYIVAEPYGEWLVMESGIMKELDYNFDLVYVKDKTEFCSDSVFNDMIKNRFVDNIKLNYEAPKSEDSKNIIELFQEQFIIPKKFKDFGLLGKAYIQFEVDTLGSINNIKIAKRNNVDLDKEAVRVLRSIKLSEPAKFKGVPVAICLIMPVSF